MGHAPKLPPMPAAPPPPPTPANLAQKPGGLKTPNLGGTFLTAAMPNAAPLTKPRKTLLGQ